MNTQPTLLTYDDTIQYLFAQRPAFERDGSSGYKPGLATIETLCRGLGNPQHRFRSIHIAGTNGKGSVAAMLAAVLQTNGYRVGLFTSPHFVDFRERIRVDGEMIPRERVVDLARELQRIETPSQASFFELTTAMAFKYFADCAIDIAVVECGLGGRLDSTNIITPVLSVITNVGLDHTDLLGNTLKMVAGEKAGIIKAGVPVVVGRACDEVRSVMLAKANLMNAPVSFADEHLAVVESTREYRHLVVNSARYGVFVCELAGDYQAENVNTVLVAVDILRSNGVAMRDELVAWAFNRINRLTGFSGRWQTVGERPLTIVDSAHNPEAITRALAQLQREYTSGDYASLTVVLGFMADKAVEQMLGLLPPDAIYIFTQSHSARAMSATQLATLAARHHLHGQIVDDVAEAFRQARRQAGTDGLVYIGGSMYVLAEVFAYLESEKK